MLLVCCSYGEKVVTLREEIIAEEISAEEIIAELKILTNLIFKIN